MSAIHKYQKKQNKKPKNKKQKTKQNKKKGSLFLFTNKVFQSFPNLSKTPNQIKFTGVKRL